MKKERGTFSRHRNALPRHDSVVPVQVDSGGRRYVNAGAFLKNERIRRVLKKTEQIPVTGTAAPER